MVKRPRFRVIRFVVSPVVSPGGVKIGKLVITRDDHKNCSTPLDIAICAEMTTGAKSSKNAVLSLGNLRSIR